jgi:hypothetical protein
VPDRFELPDLEELDMKKSALVLAALTAIFLFLPTSLFPDKANVITDPKPTHFEKQEHYIELIKFKEIGPDFDDDHFFARPLALTADNEGGFFVLDTKLMKLFKFDKRFNLVKVFLEHGAGPGEISKKPAGLFLLRFAHDGHLYLTAPLNHKIIVFDKNGNFVRDIRLHNIIMPNFPPVIDKQGNFYTISRKNPGLDVLDKNLAFKYTLLSKGDFNRHLFHCAKGSHPRVSEYIMHDNGATRYDILSDGRLIVYLPNSSTVHIFKGNQPVKHFDVWPQDALKNMKIELERRKKKHKDENFSIYLSTQFIIDKDNEKYFYIRSYSYEDKKILLYKFDLDGNLISIFFTKSPFLLLEKRNNLFYGWSRETVSVLKVPK